MVFVLHVVVVEQKLVQQQILILHVLMDISLILQHVLLVNLMQKHVLQLVQQLDVMMDSI